MSFRTFLLPYFLLILTTQFINAAPLFGIGNTRSKDPVSTLPKEEEDGLSRVARFAQLAYCPAESIRNVPFPRDAILGIEIIAAGGDDGLVPGYYIAHDPTAQSIIVAHQGTKSSNPWSVLNDIRFQLEPLDKELFPTLNSAIKVHEGFSDTHARTAKEIVGNVTAALTEKGVNKVEVVGHSLGGAIGALDAMLLKQELGDNTTIQLTVFGVPRSGNQNWANFVDQSGVKVVHVHKGDDTVGNLPPKVLGYQHFSGEIHISADSSSEDTQADGVSIVCPGQENQDAKCLSGQSILASSVSDHFGPFYGMTMREYSCPL